MSRKMKDSCVPWVGDIPEKWSAQSVKNLVEPGKNGIKIGPFGSALKGKTLDAGPVKIYNQANLISEDFDVSRHFVSEETFKELSAYQVFPGDILFSMMGTIGKCCQMPANKQVGITKTDRISLVREDEKEYFDIRTDRTSEGWEVYYKIPLEFMKVFYPDYEYSGVLLANAYKCGNKTVNKHYLSWKPVNSEKPNFHVISSFGRMSFE